jgi:hypothetical protein
VAAGRPADPLAVGADGRRIQDVVVGVAVDDRDRDAVFVAGFPEVFELPAVGSPGAESIMKALADPVDEPTEVMAIEAAA